MNATLELIKAKQNAIIADEEMKIAKAKRDFEVMTQTFEPLVKIIEEAKDLPTREAADYCAISLSPKDRRTVGAFIHEKELRGYLLIMRSKDGRLNHCSTRAPRMSIAGAGSITTNPTGKLFISTKDGASSRQEAIDWLIEAIARLVK
jgi:hypothetical protein